VKYKAIRSAAHNFGASFVSGQNWAGGDQVMTHLLRAAASSGEGRMSVDLLTGQAGPAALVTPAIAEAVERSVQRFPEFLAQQQVAIAHVRAAELVVRFNLEDEPATHGARDVPRAPFECVVTIVDDRGKQHTGRVKDIWPWAQ
jgi:hypothetical protein